MARRERKKRWSGDERRGPATVLVAGDVDDSNELLSRILVSHGYRTVTATSVDSGLSRVVEQLPRAAVIDLSSRGIGSSLQLLDSIRSSDDPRVERTRVVIIARSSANRNFSFQSGADGFLLRPFHANDLVAMVGEVLAVAHEDLNLHRRRMIDAGRKD